MADWWGRATWASTSAERATGRFDPQGGRHDRRAVAVTDGGVVGRDGDARRSETNNHARSTRLSTANQKRAALLDLGHRSDHGDDGRRTADDGLHASSDLGREEEDGEV